MSMYQLARQTTNNGDATSFSYGATPNSMTTWDAEMIHGCYCDAPYRSNTENAILSFDCSLASCPVGDDPLTPTLEVQTVLCRASGGTFKLTFTEPTTSNTQQTAAINFDATTATVESALEALPGVRDVSVAFSTGSIACGSDATVGIVITFNSEWGDLADLGTDSTSLTGTVTLSASETTKGTTLQNFETQTITCAANGGSFTITFRQETTEPISYSATAANVETAIEELSSVDDVIVTYSTGSVACSASGVGIQIQFISELGDLPSITTDVTSLTLTGGSASATPASTISGTKDSYECSNHGLCDRTTGFCKCFAGFSSSDHNSNAGTFNDCGKVNLLAKGG